MKFIVENQSVNGAWYTKKKKHNEPTPYFRSSLETARAMMSLFYNGTNYASFAKGMRYLLKTHLDIHEYVEIKAPIARIYSLMSSKYLKLRAREIVATVIENPYEIYEPLETLGIFFLCDNLWWALSGSLKEELKQKIIEGKAKDGKGWGARFNDKKSEPTFTANAILSLFRLGINKEEVEKEISSFLQMGKNGRWPNSHLTIKKYTTYATALGTKILLLIDENADKSLEFLEKSRNKDGGWPLLPGEDSAIYTTYYVSELLWFNEMAKKFGTWNVFKNQIEYEKMWFHKFLAESILQGKAMGSTQKAIERRKLIMDVLAKGPMDAAHVIDELKARGLNLSKKYHMTQIKVDLEHLKDLGIIAKDNYTYYLIY